MRKGPLPTIGPYPAYPSIPFVELAHFIVDALVCGAEHAPYIRGSHVLKHHAYDTLSVVRYSPSTCTNAKLEKLTHFFNSENLLFFSHFFKLCFAKWLDACKYLPTRLEKSVHRNHRTQTYRSFHSIRAGKVDA